MQRALCLQNNSDFKNRVEGEKRWTGKLDGENNDPIHRTGTYTLGPTGPSHSDSSLS